LLIVWRPQSIIYLMIPPTIVPKYFQVDISIGHVSVYLYDILVFLFCLSAIYISMIRLVKKKPIFNLNDDTKFVVLLVGIYLILHLFYFLAAMIQGIQPASSARRFLLYSGVLYFFMPILFIDEKHKIDALITFIVVMSVLALLHQVYSFAFASRWQNYTSSGTVRLGIKGVSLIGCAMLAILVFKEKLKYYLLSTCPILSIILVGHRSGLIALGASLVALFALTKKASKTLILIYLLSGSLILSLTILEVFTGHSFIDDTITRGKDTFNTDNATSIGRIDKIRHNYMVFKKNPIFGIGYNYESIGKDLNRTMSFNVDPEMIEKVEHDVRHPHNFILKLLSHTGLTGTLLVILISALSLKNCYNVGRADNYNSPYGIFLFCSIVFFLFFALMNTTFTSEGWFFWLLCGMSALLRPKLLETDHKEITVSAKQES
jgi:O-antigen ligase